MERVRTPFLPEEKKSILVFSLVLFFRMFSLFMVLPLFNYMAVGLEGATPFLVGLAFGGYGLTQSIFQIPFGLWSDMTDRKKTLLVGLAVFAGGSLLSAFAEDIFWMIAGRLLQGVGAISAIIFAMIADFTRPEIRASANAFLGMSIGLSFILAFIIAPAMASFLTLQYIFLIIFGLAVLCIFLVVFTIKKPEKKVRTNVGAIKLLKTAIAQKNIQDIYLGSFVVGYSMTLFLYNTQLDLKAQGVEKGGLWMYYVPVVLLSVPAMFGAAMFAQRHNKFKEVIMAGIVAMLIAYSFHLFALHYLPEAWASFVVLALFFIAFNFFEPIFPSLLTIKSSPEIKGTASGYFNFFQFMGNFAGSALAGWFYMSSRDMPLIIGGVLLVAYFFVNARSKNPENFKKASA